MDLVSDSLLLAATFGAALYCHVLARRLRRFTALETGMGGAIAVLSAQVDDMTRAVQQAQGAASGAERRLQVLVQRAEEVAGRLELMIAALHDLPDESPSVAATRPKRPRARFVRRRDLSLEVGG